MFMSAVCLIRTEWPGLEGDTSLASADRGNICIELDVYSF
jgi:hypothetical protein